MCAVPLQRDTDTCSQSFNSILGTSSTRDALAIILDGNCYHMSSVFMGEDKDWDFWERALVDLDRDDKQITDQVPLVISS